MLGAYLVTFGAASFAAFMALTFYNWISHLDPPERQSVSEAPHKAA
jgi:hypothetical protein